MRCEACWDAFDLRQQEAAALEAQQEEIRALERMGVPFDHPSLSQLLDDDGFEFLTGQLAALRLRRWTSHGGGCYLYGPDSLRDALARAAARELWPSRGSDLEVASEAEWLDAALSRDNPRRHSLARAPWLILLDVGLRTATRIPATALYDLLRQRHLSHRAVGTLFVSHRPPSETRTRLQTALDSRHAADLFEQLFAANVIATTGGPTSQSSRFMQLSPELSELVPLEAWESSRSDSAYSEPILERQPLEIL